MEVDSSAIDERKEEGNAALLQVDEQPDGGPSDSSSQSIDGQTQILRGPKVIQPFVRRAWCNVELHVVAETN